VAILAVGLVACAGRGGTGDFGADRAQIDLRIAPPTPAVGAAQLALTLADPSGAPLDGATVEIEGTMTHAGMRPVFAQARGQGDGRYQVDAFTFTMAGDWLLIVKVTLPDGGRAQRTFPVDGVREGAMAPPPKPIGG
jgi:hypothetical protein